MSRVLSWRERCTQNCDSRNRTTEHPFSSNRQHMPCYGRTSTDCLAAPQSGGPLCRLAICERCGDATGGRERRKRIETSLHSRDRRSSSNRRRTRRIRRRRTGGLRTSDRLRRGNRVRHTAAVVRKSSEIHRKHIIRLIKSPRAKINVVIRVAIIVLASFHCVVEYVQFTMNLIL